MGLYTLAYVSVETRPMSAHHILNILNKARDKNKQLNITGMLLYRQGYFIQALEGEQAAVEALYDTIKQDERHQNVLVVYKNEISGRSFPDWSMGFTNLDTVQPDEIEGYNNFLSTPITDVAKEPSRTRQLLELFKEAGGF
jgi:hypothetical protein